jgi:hypothetical protein
MARTWESASALLLAGLLAFGLGTIWIPQRWPAGVWQAGIFALALAWAARMLWRPYRLRISFPLIPLGGAVLCGLLQLLFGWTVYRFETASAVLRWAACLFVFWLSLQVCSSPDLLRASRRAVVYFGFALSILSTIQFFTSPYRVFWVFPVEHTNGLLGPFTNRDHYATWMQLVLPLVLFEAARDRRRTLSHALMAGVMFASVIAGASRAGSILVTLEIVVVLFLTRGRVLSWTALFAAVFVAVVGWEALWRRFQEPDPYQGRRELLRSSLAMVRERPWTGFGLGAWPTAYPAYALRDFGPGRFANHAHNDWAEWAAEGGLPFFLLLLAVAVWSCRQVARAPWGVGVVAVFCHCLVDFPMQRPALAVQLCALLGALAAAGAGKDSGADGPFVFKRPGGIGRADRRGGNDSAYDGHLGPGRYPHGHRHGHGGARGAFPAGLLELADPNDLRGAGGRLGARNRRAHDLDDVARLLGQPLPLQFHGDVGGLIRQEELPVLGPQAAGEPGRSSGDLRSQLQGASRKHLGHQQTLRARYPHRSV